MKFIPAIDLKNNQCVRLEKGLENRLEVFNTNPIEQAKIFENLGCQRLHIVDLDEAFGRQNINKETILKIRNEISIPIELGGGIRTIEDIFFWKKKRQSLKTKSYKTFFIKTRISNFLIS